MNKALNRIPRAAFPEEVGVSSEAVLHFIEELEKKKLFIHSVTVLRKGKVAAEIYKTPYNPDTAHCMFSISKSITSLALGFAVSEKLVSLDSKVINYFPEFYRADDKYLSRLTVRHLITMTAGKFPSYLLNKTDKDWLAHFFNAKWDAAPGKVFRYINENFFVLTSIIRKVTNQTVCEYLTPRLFAPLEIKTPFWESDHYGTEAGGWGIRMTPEDFSKIFLCISQQGKYNGKQIIPYEYLSLATLNQAITKNDPGPCKKEGYGFGFWRKNSYIYNGEGMYGQYGIINEKNDTVVIITSGETRSGTWEAYMKYCDRFVTDKTSDPKNFKALAEKCTQWKADNIEKSDIRSRYESILQNVPIKLSENTFGDKILKLPVGMVPTPCIYMSKDRGGNIDFIRLNFSENECSFTWTEKNVTNTALCGMDGEYRESTATLCSSTYTLMSYAKWLDETKLFISIRTMESTGKRNFTLDFSNYPKIKITPTSEPNMDLIVHSISGDLENAHSGKVYQAAIQKLLKALERAAEPQFAAKIKNV